MIFLRLNSLAPSCSFAQLKDDPEQELIKLVFLASISSPELKPSLLDHLCIQSDVLFLELVSLATMIQSERLFALGTGKPCEPTFSIRNTAVSLQHQPPTRRGHYVPHTLWESANKSAPYLVEISEKVTTEILVSGLWYEVLQLSKTTPLEQVLP